VEKKPDITDFGMSQDAWDSEISADSPLWVVCWAVERRLAMWRNAALCCTMSEADAERIANVFECEVKGEAPDVATQFSAFATTKGEIDTQAADLGIGVKCFRPTDVILVCEAFGVEFP
jgi:hypothetical protein